MTVCSTSAAQPDRGLTVSWTGPSSFVPLVLHMLTARVCHELQSGCTVVMTGSVANGTTFW